MSWVILAFVILGSLSRRAEAQSDPARVEDLIRRAVESRRSGNDNRALPLFQQAYELSPTPRTAAQLGLVEMALGYKLDAERHLAEALASSQDLWVKRNHLVLEQSLATVKSSIGDVLVKGTTGAQVIVNGRLIGLLPMSVPVRIGEGPTTIEVRAPGFVTDRRSFGVVGGKQVEVTFDLHRDDTTRSRATATETTARLTARQPAPSHEASASTGDEPYKSAAAPRLTRSAAWASAAGAAALLSVGVVETVVWLRRKHDFEQHLGPSVDNPSMVVPNCGSADRDRGGPGCRKLFDELNKAKTWALIGYGGASVLAVGSALLFANSSSAVTKQTRAACIPLWMTAGAICRLSF